MKFSNTLPEGPSFPKFLRYPFDPLRFIQYAPSLLEKNYTHTLLTETELLIPDLIDPHIYSTPNPKPEMAAEDLQLISSKKNEDNKTKAIPWLRKTEYITSDFSRNYTRDISNSITRKEQKERELSKEDRIKKIESSFARAKQKIEHPTNPSLKPVEILPIFPDFQTWENSFQEIIFDSDPTPRDKTQKRKRTEYDLEKALIKGFSHKGANQSTTQKFLAYLIPSKKIKKNPKDEASEDEFKEKEEQEEQEEEKEEENSEEEQDQDGEKYQWCREYIYDIKKEQRTNYFLTFSHDQVKYNKIELQLQLRKSTTPIPFEIPRKITSKEIEVPEKEQERRQQKLSFFNALED